MLGAHHARHVVFCFKAKQGKGIVGTFLQNQPILKEGQHTFPLVIIVLQPLPL
jgi:hypothetical protein